MTRSVGRLAVAAVLAAMLSACGTTAVTHATAPFSGTVTVVFYKSYSDLMEAYSRAPGRPKLPFYSDLMPGAAAFQMGKLGSFETFDRSILDGGACTIHMLYPGGHTTDADLGEDLSHATAHCMGWHTHQHGADLRKK